MNRSLSVLALLAVPITAFGATMSITVGGAMTVNANPGQTLVVDLRLSDVTIGVVEFEARLNDLGGTGKLSIVGAMASDARTWGATFNTAIGDFPLVADVRGVLNPRSKDLGCIAASVFEYGYGPELYPSTLESIKVLVAPAATIGSTLTIGLSDLFLVDVNVVPIQVSAGPDLTITVTSNQEPDADGDGVPDRIDNCPNVANPDQADADSDGIGDACDNCPDDPNKSSPGVCGCGVADTDSDGDGTADCNDNCPNQANADQADADSDGIGDVCDSCPRDPSNDADRDGVCGDQDACPDSADLSAPIIIADCDTGVTNHMLEGGCTMVDEIVKAAEANENEAGNHGQFVSAVAHLTKAWLLTKADKDRIQSCAAKSPKPGSAPQPVTSAATRNQAVTVQNESILSSEPVAPVAIPACGAGLVEAALLSLAGSLCLSRRRRSS